MSERLVDQALGAARSLGRSEGLGLAIKVLRRLARANLESAKEELHELTRRVPENASQSEGRRSVKVGPET